MRREQFARITVRIADKLIYLARAQWRGQPYQLCWCGAPQSRSTSIVGIQQTTTSRTRKNPFIKQPISSGELGI